MKTTTCSQIAVLIIVALGAAMYWYEVGRVSDDYIGRISNDYIVPELTQAIGVTKSPNAGNSTQHENLAVPDVTSPAGINPDYFQIASSSIDQYVDIASCVVNDKHIGFGSFMRNIVLSSAVKSKNVDCKKLDEVTRRKRLEYVEKAAMEGVPAAAVFFAFEGPFGDPSAIETRPDDPMVKEWRDKAMSYLTLAANSGDRPALTLLSQIDVGVLGLSQPGATADIYVLAMSTISRLEGSEPFVSSADVMARIDKWPQNERLLIERSAAEIVRKATAKKISCQRNLECN